MKHSTKLKTLAVALTLASSFTLNAQTTNLIRIFGMVVDQTCNVSDGTNKTTIIEMPFVKKADFAGKDNTTGHKAFTLNLENCDPAANSKSVAVRFKVPTDDITLSGNVKNMATKEIGFPSGSDASELAQGVSYQLTNGAENKPINLKSANPRSEYATIAASTTGINLGVQYYADVEPKDITTGKVTAKIEYILEYK